VECVTKFSTKGRSDLQSKKILFYGVFLQSDEKKLTVSLRHQRIVQEASDQQRILLLLFILGQESSNSIYPHETARSQTYYDIQVFSLDDGLLNPFKQQKKNFRRAYSRNTAAKSCSVASYGGRLF